MQRQLLVAALVAASWTMTTPADAAAEGCAYAHSMPARVGTEKAAEAVRCLVNQERAKAGLPALTESPKLGRSAALYARRMAREDFFSHVTPGGGRLEHRLRAAGWASQNRRWKASQTIGWGMGRNSRPERIVGNWMADPRDRAVLLSSSSTEVGVGVSRGLPFRSKCKGATYALYVGRR